MLKQKNLIFVGAPGAGKGTFSAWLLEKEPLVHISTGDLLRDEIARGTDLGKAASGLMKEGKLVPDEIVAGMVRARLSRPDCDSGFILDGFPRTLNQAKILDDVLRETGRNLDRVVWFKVPDEVLFQRLTARMSCRKCDEIYNRLFKPPRVAGVCDKCGGELWQRPDDSLETAKKRLAVFCSDTLPAIRHYEATGKVLEITELDKSAIQSILERELY